jgi:hypothetical protein
MNLFNWFKRKQINVGFGEVIIGTAYSSEHNISAIMFFDSSKNPGNVREDVVDVKNQELLAQVNFHTIDSIDHIIEMLNNIKLEMK